MVLQNNADLDAMGVKKVTNIGGVIANATNNTDGTLTDHGKLNYSGELELKDIEDHNYNSSSGFNVSTTIGIPQKGTQEASTAPKGSTTVGVNRSGQETEQLTKATLGQGTVKNATDSTNRDINNTQEITRDQTIGMLDGSVTVDHRLLTEAGRKEIIQEQKDLPENFRQSTENLALALPDGEYKDKVLQTLNNVQASLVKMPEEMRAGGETLADNYAEYIKKGGEPKDFELMMNDPDILAGIKAVNDLNTIKNQAIVTLMSQGLSQEQANNLVNQSESGVIDENGIRSFILERIKVQASAGIIVPNAKDEQAKFGQEQLDIDKTSNIVIDAVTQMGQIKQKVDQRITDSNINPEYVGLALGLVLGGPANLVKSEVIGQIFGDEIAAITDRLKTEGAAYLLNTDAETVENTLANKNLINQSGNETAKQLVDQLEWTKDGVGVVSGVILGGVGGAAVGKSSTTKIDGKDVDVSTAGIGNRGELTKPYDPNQTRKDLEAVHDKENVKSTTVPPDGAKNVKLAGQRHPVTGVVFDKKGYPIFDDIAKYDTNLIQKGFNNLTYKEQMQIASKDLWSAIEKGDVKSSQFNAKQLKQIESGNSKIDGFTWHHHQDQGRMQLVPEWEHAKTGHIGGDAMKSGK